MYEQHIKLWRDVFSDELEFIEDFYKQNHNRLKIFSTSDGEKLTSMLHVLPYMASNKGRLFKCPYIYSCATHKDYRGKGLMGENISRAIEAASDNGAKMICLLPTSAGLYDYYARFGFQKGPYKLIFEDKFDTLKRNYEKYNLCLDNNKIYNAYRFFLDKIDAIIKDKDDFLYYLSAMEKMNFKAVSYYDGKTPVCFAIFKEKNLTLYEYFGTVNLKSSKAPHGMIFKLDDTVSVDDFYMNGMLE